MPLHIAEHIRLLRTGRVMHSHRKLSEVICDIYPEFIKETLGEFDLRGNQLHGQGLCEAAAEVLGVSKEDYQEHWL